MERALNAVNTVISAPYYYLVVHDNWGREHILRELERGTDIACHHVQEVEGAATGAHAHAGQQQGMRNVSGRATPFG